MRKLLLFSLFVTANYLLPAQAHEGKIDYAKKSQPCLVIDYSYSTQACENAITSRMDKLGYKGKEEKGIFNKDKGFKVYNNTLIGDISSTRYDYLFKVERKSRKDDNAATVYFLIQTGDSAALTKLNADDLGKAKTFLYNLIPDIEAADLELQIKAQEGIVAKADKKLKTLQSDKEEMEKKIKKLQDDIKDNIKNQESQQKELENQQKALEDLRAKRKS